MTSADEMRSRVMRAVKSVNTGPEMTVRRQLHALGYRYRLHRKDLPGKPDLVFPGRRKAIFVHGCFWHVHGCRRSRLPKTRQDYWIPKLARNRERDTENRFALEELGWTVLTVWECELKEMETLTARLRLFLDSDPANGLGPLD